MDGITDAETGLCRTIGQALTTDTLLQAVSGGTKGSLGRPMDARKLELGGFSGISLYEPDELVLTAGAATPLAEISRALSEHNQHLAFEPPDFGALLGTDMAGQTIGGVIACNLAGPRRPRAGSARDHFLGVRAVTGRGEFFKSGGRVVKNVTGYDMCKLLAGSFGTLAAMTEITIKVIPAPEKIRTLLVYGLSGAKAVSLMSETLGSPVDISAACHLPPGIAARSGVGRVRDPNASVTALRIEGPEPSVAARSEALYRMISPHGKTEELHRHNSETFWGEVGGCVYFASAENAAESAVWRVSAPPAEGAALTETVSARLAVDSFLDWGGGLVWISTEDTGDAGAAAIREAAIRHGGHAMLVRARPATRMSVPVFQPQPPPLAALTARVKDAFDPRRILGTGRMYAEL